MKFRNASFESLSGKEWLVTNGLGGYASSTISGANTRRYHGLFVPSLNPPTERTVMVTKVEETIIKDDQTSIELSSNQYPDVIHPNGYQWITSFERKPFPTTTFQGDGFKLMKTVFMVHGSNTTVIMYQNKGRESITLALNPLFVLRDYHSLFHEHDHFDFYREEDGKVSVIYPLYGAKPLYLECTKGTFHAQKTWYRNFIYARESYRGLEDREDACTIGQYKMKLGPSEKAFLVFSLEKEQLLQDWEKVYKQQVDRLQKLINTTDSKFSISLPPDILQFYQDLAVAGDQFLVNRGHNEGKTIIAGYHWFTDWGRDTMIAMRGLVIAAGHQQIARQIIRTFLLHMKDGLLPNRFPDHGEMPEYNTIDASLWLFIVLYEYQQKFQDIAFVEECLPSLREILNAYADGTKFNIHMTKEGLIFGGEGLFQLTWMDAKVGDHVVTPRQGCPVEINALWYNAICIFNDFLKLVGIREERWMGLEEKVRENFRAHFMNAKGYLHDVIIPCEYIDDSFRPNQLYAISLPFSLLSKEECQFLLANIYEKLWTPLGLRSLAQDHPDFIGKYGGDQWHRDTAYHQGTVWSFLMGEYLLAVLKTSNDSITSKIKVVELMKGLQHHFYNEDGIHCVSEIFDGLDPHVGRGCMQQAWSVGMLLMVFDRLKYMGGQKTKVKGRRTRLAEEV